jgi:tetratricopeptide (TPR) repeat protein
VIKRIPFLFLLVVLFASLSFSLKAADTELKKLTSNKEDLNSLQAAQAIFQDQIAKNPQDFDLRIQGADNAYYLGVQLNDKAAKKTYLLQGIDWAKQAIILKPDAPSGHFFYGILTGLYVEMSDFFTALKSKDIIKDEMEKVVSLDPHYSDGDAYIALGEWYAAVPFFMGGSDSKAKDFLQKAIEMGPGRAKPHLALAEFYSKRFKYDLAKKEIDLVMTSPVDSTFAFENKRDQEEAKTLLKKIESKLSQPTRGYEKERLNSLPSPPGPGF